VAVTAITITAQASDKNEFEDPRPPPPDNIRIPLFSFTTR
jgi:hypothetical protein